jgi:hypothetical protein
MRFRSLTEIEIRRDSIWPSGIFEFEIREAEEKTSHGGNAMIELHIEIQRRDGAKHLIRDWLLDKRPEKLFHACRVCGLLDKYESGVLSEDDFVGCRGKLKLGIQRASAGYPRRNVVIDYVSGEEHEHGEKQDA